MTDTDIHSCGYYCEHPACIKRQRDELRDKLFLDQAVKPNHGQPTKLMGPNLEGVLNAAGYVKKKEWVGLTDDEMADFTLFHAVVDEECIRAIEAKLKEKNNV